MFKTDVSTAVPSLPSPAAAGTPGYFTGGNPGSGIPATVVDADFLNMMMMELANICTAGGQTLSKTTYNQALLAIEELIELRSGNYALDTGIANAYVVALSPPITSYTADFSGRFKVSNANTGASTLNAGGGVVALVNEVGSALALGDLPLGAVVSYSYVLADNKAYITSLVPTQMMTQTLFEKAASTFPCFAKTGASTLSILAGTRVVVAGVPLSFSIDTAVVMPALTSGNDYAVYACTDGTIRADASFTAPTGYTTANSRMIGGFHYGLVAPGTTVAGGSFATTGNGMIWVQSNVDDIAGINKYSIWDLKFRPVGADPRGMVLVGGRTWVDIYLCSTDTAANGTSKYNTNIASGTVLPKIPAAFGGNGTTTYPTLNWWVANELARANQKRLMWEHEFVDAAFGVTENQSIDATASTYPTTLRNAGYTSKYGIEQASGHQWTWGQDSSYDPQGTATPANYDVNGNNGAGTGRGQIYMFTSVGQIRALFGGTRSYGANSGSRASSWNTYPWNSYWSHGLRAACDHMQLD